MQKMSFLVFIKAYFFGETFLVVTSNKSSLQGKPYIRVRMPAILNNV